MSEMSVVVFAFEDKDGNVYRAAGAIGPLVQEGDRTQIHLHDDGTPELDLKMTSHQVVTDATFGDIMIGSSTGFRPERLYMNSSPSPMPDPDSFLHLDWSSGV